MQKIRTLLAVALLAAVAQTAQAGDCCPDCGTKVCTVKWVQKTVKKKVYRVECKDICIPAIRLPWQMGCEPRCGTVRTIKVLKSIDVKCQKCGCEWAVQKVVDSCGAAVGGCGCTDCAKKKVAVKGVKSTKKAKTKSLFPTLLYFGSTRSKAKATTKPRSVTARRTQTQQAPRLRYDDSKSRNESGRRIRYSQYNNKR